MADINSFIVYGHTGTGKTFLTAQVMSNALWVVTRKSNLGAYHSWIREHPNDAVALGLKPIESVVQMPRLMPNRETGELEPTDIRGLINDLVKEYVKKAVNGDTKVRGIVFDELSVIATWVHDAIAANERNGYDVIKKIKSWVRDLCEISTATELPMAFICHTKDPAYWEDGTRKGQLKYKGGPAMPIGTMIADLCSLPDAVLQVEVEHAGMDSVRRVIRTEAHPQWQRKCRVWGVAPTIEPDLRPLLTKAGWTFPVAA